MPQVRNTRDKIRRELIQAIGLEDNVQQYLEHVLAELMAGVESYNKLTAEQKSFYPDDYEDTMIRKTEINATILEGIETIKQSIQLLHDMI